jgi:uncharacterized protein
VGVLTSFAICGYNTRVLRRWAHLSESWQKMLVDIRDLLRDKGLGKKDVSCGIAADECGIDDLDCSFGVPIEVTAELTNINGMIRAKGRLHAEYDTFCARCLKPLRCEIDKEFDEEFAAAGAVREQDAMYAYSDKEIDLNPMVRDAVLLEIPIRHLCRPDCKSLCPKCGKDLNEGECGCRSDEYIGQFEALKGYYSQRETNIGQSGLTSGSGR